jgi:hypothetical protein
VRAGDDAVMENGDGSLSGNHPPEGSGPESERKREPVKQETRD